MSGPSLHHILPSGVIYSSRQSSTSHVLDPRATGHSPWWSLSDPIQCYGFKLKIGIFIIFVTGPTWPIHTAFTIKYQWSGPLIWSEPRWIYFRRSKIGSEPHAPIKHAAPQPCPNACAANPYKAYSSAAMPKRMRYENIRSTQLPSHSQAHALREHMEQRPWDALWTPLNTSPVVRARMENPLSRLLILEPYLSKKKMSGNYS